MKIASLRVITLSRMHEPERQWITARYRTVKADCAVVVIETDTGLRGIGEASAYGGPLGIRSWIEWLEPELLGKDPTDPAIRPIPHGRDRAYDAAAAGIDCALWDLRGKAAGERVADLLSPGAAAGVRLYASAGCGYDWRKRPEDLIDEALGYADLGYTAMKFRIGTEWEWDGVDTSRFLGLVRELSRAVEGRMELALDGNCRLTEDQALVIARELAELGFLWFEEPIPSADIDGYARLVKASGLPVTGGESLATLEQFRPYLDRRAYSIVQPDAGITGISEAFRIGRTANRFGVKLVPHSWHNGLMAMANAHLVAALPEPYFLELCMIQGPLQWEILREKPVIEGGRLRIPHSPGLGVELADGIEERFPYIEGHYAVTVNREWGG